MDSSNWQGTLLSRTKNSRVRDVTEGTPCHTLSLSQNRFSDRVSLHSWNILDLLLFSSLEFKYSWRKQRSSLVSQLFYTRPTPRFHDIWLRSWQDPGSFILLLEPVVAPSGLTSSAKSFPPTKFPHPDVTLKDRHDWNLNGFLVSIGILTLFRYSLFMFRVSFYPTSYKPPYSWGCCR